MKVLEKTPTCEKLKKGDIMIFRQSPKFALGNYYLHTRISNRNGLCLAGIRKGRSSQTTDGDTMTENDVLTEKQFNTFLNAETNNAEKQAKLMAFQIGRRGSGRHIIAYIFELLRKAK